MTECGDHENTSSMRMALKIIFCPQSLSQIASRSGVRVVENTPQNDIPFLIDVFFFLIAVNLKKNADC